MKPRHISEEPRLEIVPPSPPRKSPVVVDYEALEKKLDEILIKVKERRKVRNAG